MAKMFLDLAQMKASGKSKEGLAVFKHRDGHEIHVDPKNLSPKVRGELEGLVKKAKGGEIEQSNPKLEQSKLTPNTRALHKYAEGTPDGPIQLPDQDQIPINLSQAPGTIPPDAQTPQDPGSAPYGTVPADNLAQNPLGGLQDQAGPQSGDAIPQTPDQPTPQPDASPNQAGPAQIPTPQPPTPAETTPYSAIAGGVEKEKQGIQQVADAQQAASKATADAITAEQIKRQQDDQPYMQQIQELETERRSIAQEIKDGHIKPDQYISQMDVPQKLSTAIGLILGGIGGGILHEENPAMKFLNAQIDRNIAAQQSELGKKENLLSANIRQFGNLQQARDFTRINHNDIIKNMVDKAVAENGGQLAQGQGAQLIGQLEQKSGMLQAKWGAINTIQHGGASEGVVNQALQKLDIADPEMAKQLRAKMVPGVGMAEVDVPSEVRSKILAQRQLDERAKDLYSWASAHTGSLNPKNVAVGREKAMALQSLYREGMLGTVYKSGEQPLLDKVVNSDPTSFFNAVSTLPKLKEVIDSNSALYGKLNNQYGIRPFGGQQNQQQSQTPAIRTFIPR